MYTDRMRRQGDNAAAAVLCVSFACGCAVGAALVSRDAPELLAARISDAGLTAWSLSASLWAVLPWSCAAVLCGLFVSAGITLPLLLLLRGCTVGCTVAAFLSSCGTVQGMTAFFAGCGARCLLSVLSVFAAAVPCLSDTFLRLRLRWRRRLCVPDAHFFRGAAASMLLSTCAVLADRFLRPLLAALLL